MLYWNMYPCVPKADNRDMKDNPKYIKQGESTSQLVWHFYHSVGKKEKGIHTLSQYMLILYLETTKETAVEDGK